MTKFILVIFNVIFVILGIVVLGVGLYAKFDNNGLAALFSKIPSKVISGEDLVDIPSLISSASLALIVGGSFILIVGFLGCCGAWKEVSCFLIIYSLVLVLLIIVEIAFVVVMYAAKDKIEGHLFKFLMITINKAYTGGTGFSNKTFSLTKDATTLAWDMTQFSLQCCGTHGFDDYKNATAWNHKVSILSANGTEESITAKVPLSCCKMKDPSVFPKELEKLRFLDAQKCLTAPSNATANGVGCYEAVKGKLLQYSMISAGVALGIALLEICGLLCACWLYKSLQKNKGYEQQQ